MRSILWGSRESGLTLLNLAGSPIGYKVGMAAAKKALDQFDGPSLRRKNKEERKENVFGTVIHPQPCPVDSG